MGKTYATVAEFDRERSAEFAELVATIGSALRVTVCAHTGDDRRRCACGEDAEYAAINRRAPTPFDYIERVGVVKAVVGNA